MRDSLNDLWAPFRGAGKLRWLLIGLFILINGLVLTNALIHDPRTGYDAADHLNYIKTLATTHALPTCKDTGQCYVPPLPYLLPALALTTGHVTLVQAAMLAQLVDVVLSIVLCYYLLRTCDLIQPGNTSLKVSALLLLGIVPLYYKTFALIRGETYLATLFVFAFYLTLSIFVAGRATPANILMLGLTAGICILARQWGLLVLPAVLVFAAYVGLRDRTKLKAAVLVSAACLVMPVLVAGWYYAAMYDRYGTFLAAGWDRNAAIQNQSALPLSFFTGLGSGHLFADPLRPNFSNQLPAIFYADTWGDYGAYFLVYGRNMTSGDYISGQFLQRLIAAGPTLPANVETNWYTLGRYLGQVDLVSLFPSAVILAGLLSAGIRTAGWLRPSAKGDLHLDISLAVLLVGSSLVGYLWYLLKYRIDGQAGDLIKALHMIQVFPILALLGAEALEWLRSRTKIVWLAVMICLGLVFAFDAPAMITRYVLFR